MDKEIIEMICENCNWCERIIVKLLKKFFIKIYNIVRVDVINSLIKK